MKHPTSFRHSSLAFLLVAVAALATPIAASASSVSGRTELDDAEDGAYDAGRPGEGEVAKSVGGNYGFRKENGIPFHTGLNWLARCKTPDGQVVNIVNKGASTTSEGKLRSLNTILNDRPFRMYFHEAADARKALRGDIEIKENDLTELPLAKRMGLMGFSGIYGDSSSKYQVVFQSNDDIKLIVSGRAINCGGLIPMRGL